MIVQRLLTIQKESGFLPDKALKALARETGTPLYRIQEVASFFPHFRQEWNPPPFVEIKVCRDMSCHLAGSAELIHSKEAGLRRFAKTGEHSVVVEGTSCLGRCDRAPACTISRHNHDDANASFHDRVYAGKSAGELQEIVRAIVAGGPPPADTPDAGRGMPRANWEIDPYARRPELKARPFAAARDYLEKYPAIVPPPPAGLKAEQVKEYIKTRQPMLLQLEAAALLGMGGAGAPAYQKWLDVWQARGDAKYIVANGDESEPGTFKDRELLLNAPHLVVEGVIIAGLITGATAGYIYIRHEYPEQIAAVRAEIARAEAVLADAFRQAGRKFPVEVFVSPGGYICGEQSALIEAMEDRRAQPRNRPPELQTNGLYDKPTVVNNVETLSWVPAIMLDGGDWYAKKGLPGCKGRRFFSISGDLNAAGAFEVPIGTTLGELIDLAGGVRTGRKLKAVAPSGPSGGFLSARLPVAKGVQARFDKKLATVRSETEKAMLSEFVKANLLPDGVEAATFDVRALPLDLNFWRTVASVIGVKVDLMLGAGLVVYDDSRDMLIEARNCTQFYRSESCGKCVPCRIGSEKLVGVGTELVRRRDGAAPADGDSAPAISDAFMGRVKENVLEMAKVMSLTSICGLGQVAANPLATALELFPEDVRLPHRGA